MKQLRKIALIVAATLSIGGCATVFTGSSQSINVQAIDARTQELLPGARCVVIDGNGNPLHVPSNPGRVLVDKGKGNLNVKCSLAGYHQSHIGVGQSFNAWSVVNVLFWPGIIVDAATGAIQKYPSHITVLMSPARR